MRRPRWQLMRALRVLIACLAVTLAAGPTGGARLWAETAVLIAQASSVAATAPAAPKASQAPRQAAAIAVAAASTPRAPLLLREEAPAPALDAPDSAVVEDRYLRNCALLC